jgi:hypothetical protein
MSRIARALWAVGFGTLIMVTGRPAAAQTGDTAAREEALARRIDELMPRYRAAEAAADRADAEVERATRGTAQDTVMVGPLRIVTTVDQVEEAARLWSPEWAFFEPIIGSQTAALAQTTFIHHRKPKLYAYQVSAPYVRSVDFRRPVSDQRMRAAIHQAIGGEAVRALPEVISWWTGDTALDTRMVRSRMYALFIGSPSALAQSCASGSNESCWTAFGDMDPSLDVVSTWLTADEQRAMAVLVHAGSAAREACMAGSSDACHELVEGAVTDRSVMPYVHTLRATLLWFALSEGGAGSLDRLVESVAAAGRPAGNTTAVDDAGRLLGAITDIRTHLERASGLDGDVLIERWRDQTLAGRPGRAATDDRARASTMLWIMLFAGLAARSKRWRLG